MTTKGSLNPLESSGMICLAPITETRILRHENSLKVYVEISLILSSSTVT